MKALEFLRDQTMVQADFFSAVLTAGYGASSGKVGHEYEKRQRTREFRKAGEENLRIKKKRLTAFISKMKHSGLVQETQNNKFSITNKGKKKLDQLKNALPARHYQIVDQDNPIIVSFDIPERLRRKRNWLREVLRNLGFEMIHQSVWVGKVKIPKSLITDLDNLNILEHVEIFKISKTGTLRRIGKS